MRKWIPIIGVVVTLATIPALAHTRNNDEMKSWVDRYFREVDTEGNGYITKDEFMAHAEKKFDDMDTNHDGRLSRDEVTHFKMKERDEWKSRHHGMHTGGMDRPDETRSDRDRPDINEDTKTNSGNTSNY